MYINNEDIITEDDSFKMVYKNIKQEGIKVFWSKSEDGTNSNFDNSNRYKFDDKPRYFNWEEKSFKDKKRNLLNFIGPSFSTNPGNHIEFPILECFHCKETLTITDNLKYDGDKHFCNEICWKSRIEDMITSGNYQIGDLHSFPAKRYFLKCLSSTCNGQLITKILIQLKGFLNQSEFSIVIYENNVLYHHYVAFLRETKQNNELLLWCENKFQEHLRNFRKIMQNYIDVDIDTIGHFKNAIQDFLNHIKPDVDMLYMPIAMIKEYLRLLDWQLQTNEKLINLPLIDTIIRTRMSYLAIHDDEKAMFLNDTFYFTSSEFFWTSLKAIVEENSFSDIEAALNRKIFHGKPNVYYERILAYLVSLNKEPDDFKMRCLLKIPGSSAIIKYANFYRLLDPLLEFCKENNKKKWKKLCNELSNSKS